MQEDLAQEANVGRPEAAFKAKSTTNTRDFTIIVNDFQWMVVKVVLNVLVVSIMFDEISTA